MGLTSNCLRLMSTTNLMHYMQIRQMSNKNQKVVFSETGVSEELHSKPSKFKTSEKPDFSLKSQNKESAAVIQNSKNDYWRNIRNMKQGKEEYVKDMKKMYEYQRERWINNATNKYNEDLHEDRIKEVTAKYTKGKDLKWLDKAESHAESSQDVLAALINQIGSKSKL
jgi:hypothetical protein